jgi:4'-phosphopantetheinyl transferase
VGTPKLTLRRWQADSPVASLLLEAETIAVWQVDLDERTHPISHYAESLAPNERARCTALHGELLQRRFMVRRGILRALLSAYTHIQASDIEYGYGERGKPMLTATPSLHFNVSDAEHMALYAFTRLGALGIDIEAVIPIPDMASVARDWFSPAEQAALFALPAAEQTVAFYRCWTRKEALVKAVGTGITFPLARFSVSLTQQPTILHAEDARLHEYTLLPVPLSGDYVAACAVHLAV